jgi:TatD DNase family protein
MSSLHWFDTHAHLSRESFGDDLPDVIQRMWDGGVGGVVNIGSSASVADCEESIAVAQAHPGKMWSAIGFHPHHASACDDDAFAQVIALAKAHPEVVVALGETGLDYHYMKSPKEVQQRVFRQFVEAACEEVNLPIIIHNRDSDDDCAQILREGRAERCGGILHCFSSSWDLAKICLDLGFYVSFSGMLTFKTAQAIRDAALQVPLDRLLVETDSPYLAPVPKRGKRNEPAFVSHTAMVLAGLRGLDPDAMAALLWENARRCYRLDKSAPRDSA